MNAARHATMSAAAVHADDLATQINYEHRRASEHPESAIRCGELLLAKKAELKHGEFQPWLEQHCEFKYPRAQRYMQAAGPRKAKKKKPVKRRPTVQRTPEAPPTARKTSGGRPPEVRTPEAPTAGKAKKNLVKRQRTPEALPDQRTHEALNDRAGPRIFAGNREEWCNEIVGVMLPMLAEHGITFPAERQVRCAVSPSVRGVELGVCHKSAKSADGVTNFIDISTVTAEPLELAHTLLHELLHACDDQQSGHRGRWLRWANRVGIARRGYYRGANAQQIVTTALATVGLPAQHVPSHMKKTKRKVSQIKFWCLNEHGHVHMPTLQAVGGHRVACLTCRTEMVCDEGLLATLKGEAACRPPPEQGDLLR